MMAQTVGSQLSVSGSICEGSYLQLAYREPAAMPSQATRVSLLQYCFSKYECNGNSDIGTCPL